MPINVRDAVFETNSSSTHSLTIAPDEVLDFAIPKEDLREGVITVRPHAYGWEWRRYYTPAEKMAYLLAQVSRGFFRNHRRSKLLTEKFRKANAEAEFICSTVERVTGCRVDIRPDFNAYVDNDSYGVGFEVLSSEKDLLSFLFSRQSYIETGNDNYEPGEFIETDRGKEAFRPFLFVEKAEGEARFSLTIDYDENWVELEHEGAVTKASFPFQHSIEYALIGATATRVTIVGPVGSEPMKPQRARNLALELFGSFPDENRKRVLILSDADISGRGRARAHEDLDIGNLRLELECTSPGIVLHRIRQVLSKLEHAPAAVGAALK